MLKNDLILGAIALLALAAVVAPGTEARSPRISEPAVESASRNLAATAPVQAESGRILTLLDYFDGGLRAVDRFVDEKRSSHRDLSAVLDRCRAASVLIEVRYGQSGSGYQTSAASGVVLEGGRRLLTAGHAVKGLDEFEATVTLPGGTRRDVKLIQAQYDRFGGANRDWAILEVSGPPLRGVPAIRPARAREGELAIVAGYPDHIGVDATGRAAWAGENSSYLAPIVTLATVERADPLLLSPEAGAIPTPGMSGAPVFNAAGELIGVFVSIGRRSSESEIRHTYNAASLESLMGRLRHGRVDAR
ncbi:hypothetical protein ABI59_08825 [Acidobacteria bacterium Mor1]|nr:hypothetical protein ABI59_08825 [Acidobacteria bacterium Mor1]